MLAEQSQDTAERARELAEERQTLAGRCRELEDLSRKQEALLTELRAVKDLKVRSVFRPYMPRLPPEFVSEGSKSHRVGGITSEYIG
jgi:hypothetical protein